MSNKEEEIEIRMMRPDEEPKLLAFMKANLDTWEKFEKLWKWRQEQQEISGGETAAIAKKHGKIVGCVGIVPANLIVRGKPVKASWQQDSLVSRWDLVLAKGTSKAMYGLRKSIGFADVPNSDYLVRVQKPRLRRGELKESLGEYGLYFWKIVLPLPKRGSSINLKEIDAFDQSFDNLAERNSFAAVVCLRKHHQYLNWRYVKCPRKKYDIFKAGDPRTRSAIVLTIAGEQADEGWIVDLVCDQDDKTCAYALLHKAIAYFEQQGVWRIWTFATLPAARMRLRRFGFVPSGRTPRFTYRMQNKNLHSSDLLKASWNFWHGDGDVELYM